MDGSPVRGHHKTGLTTLNRVRDTQAFQTEFVRLIRADLPQTEIFFGAVDPVSKTLQLPTWVRAQLDRHQGLTAKLEQGAMVGISHSEGAVPRPASAARSSVVLIPVLDEGTLIAAVGLVSPLDGPNLSAEEVEGVRQLANESAPILARLQEIESLTRKTRETAGIAERAARAEATALTAVEQKNHFDAAIKIGWHVQSNIAHDLRTPLAAIRGYARMILDGRSGEINDTQRDYLRVITENTNRLINVATWMNHVAELSAQNFNLSPFDLHHVWIESVQKAQEALANKSVTLTEHIPDESFEIIADREKLAFVLDELIAAAVKLADAESAISAEFSHGREREVMVKITASGSGAAPEVLSGISDRTFNSGGASLTQNANDAGGIARVYDIVGMHGGRIFVNRPSQQTATFMFTVPTVIVGGEDKSHEQAVNSSRR